MRTGNHSPDYNDSVRIVQLKAPDGHTHVALVDGGQLRLFNDCDSVYSLAQKALSESRALVEVARSCISDHGIEYEPVYRLESDWLLLPPYQHPEPARCLVPGTGLTHKASADNRQAMHKNPAEISDSMRMYLSGLEGGRPAPGTIGVAPEWFYKGCG